MPHENFANKNQEDKTDKQKVVEILSSSTSGSLFYIPYPGRSHAYALTNPATATEEEIKANMQENPLLKNLTAQDIVDACLQANNVYALIGNLPLIEKKGIIDHDMVIKAVLNIDNGTYAEYIINNLKNGTFRNVSDETLTLLSNALNGKYKDEVSEYKNSLNN